MFSWCWAAAGSCRRKNNRIVEGFVESLLDYSQQLSRLSIGITSRGQAALLLR